MHSNPSGTRNRLGKGKKITLHVEAADCSSLLQSAVCSEGRDIMMMSSPLPSRALTEEDIRWASLVGCMFSQYLLRSR